MIFIPVASHWVNYDVVARRDFFELDTLLLWAIGESPTTVEALEAEFRLHRRVVIECLLRLFEVGLVGLPNAGMAHFALTRKGREWKARYKEPSSRMTIDLPAEPRKMKDKIVQELITGRLMRARDLALTTTQQVKQPEQHLWLPPVVSPGDLDEVELRGTLRCPEQEYVLHVDNRPWPAPGGGQVFRAVYADVGAQRVYGLPPRWRPILTATILEAARHFTGSLEAPPANLIAQEGAAALDAHQFQVLDTDLLLGAADTRKYVLDRLFNAEPRSRILLVMPNLSESNLRSIAGALVAAMQRKCAIDIIWNGHTTYDSLYAIVRDLLQQAQATSDQLRFNRRALPVRTHLLLFRYSDHCEAVVASGAWMDDVDGRLEVALKLRNAGLLAVASLALAMFLERNSEFLGTITSRPWRDLAQQLYAAQRLGRSAGSEDGQPCSAAWIRSGELLPYLEQTTVAPVIRQAGAAVSPGALIAATEQALLLGSDSQQGLEPSRAFQLGLVAECDVWAGRLFATLV